MSEDWALFKSASASTSFLGGIDEHPHESLVPSLTSSLPPNAYRPQLASNETHGTAPVVAAREAANSADRFVYRVILVGGDICKRMARWRQVKEDEDGG